MESFSEFVTQSVLKSLLNMTTYILVINPTHHKSRFIFMPENAIYTKQTTGVQRLAAITSYLSNFSDSFKTAILIWPSLSFLLTLPILAYLYHRDGRIKAITVFAAYISVFYVAGLVCFTLYPLPSGTEGPGITYGIPPQLNPFNFVIDISKDGIRAVLQLVFNIILFIPMGFIANVFLKLKKVPTFAISLTATCLIETAQLTGFFGLYPYAYRTFEVGDIICNVLGAMLGWLCGKAVMHFLPKQTDEIPEITHHPSFIRRAIALWIDFMIIGFFTFMPWILASIAYELAFDQMLTVLWLDLAQTAMLICAICFVVSFATVEIVIPFKNNGSTPGGAFVRMSFETKNRTGIKRIGFYAIRTVVLVLLFLFPLYIIFGSFIYYIIKHEMPYDAI